LYNAFGFDNTLSAEHTVMMMLAVGCPKDEIKVCASARRPLNEIYTEI